MWLSYTMFLFWRLVAAIAPAGAICASANDMAKYLAYVIQQGDTSPLLPPKWIVRQAQAASNLFPTSGNIAPPAYPVSYQAVTYGFGWMQGSYRGEWEIIWGRKQWVKCLYELITFQAIVSSPTLDQYLAIIQICFIFLIFAWPSI